MSCRALPATASYFISARLYYLFFPHDKITHSILFPLWPLLRTVFSVTYFGQKWSQHILVCIIVCCFEDGRINFLARLRDFFLSTKVSTPSLGAHPTSSSLRTRSCFRGVKRPGRKADHSPPPNAGIKNA